jgi:hypothetical protein
VLANTLELFLVIDKVPSAPPYYSSADTLSLESLHQAFNASILFECGRSAPRIASSGFQRLHIIRVWTLCPSNRFMRPSAPSYYSSADALSLELLHQAFSASILFECRRSVPQIASSGLQRLHIIQVRTLCPLNRFIRPSAPSYYSSADALSLESLHQAFSASILFEYGLLSPSNLYFELSMISSHLSRNMVAIN